MTVINIKGPIPVKKNRQRIGRHGGIYKHPEVRSFEETLAWTTKIERIEQVRGKFSLSGQVRIVKAKDLDGVLSTILDGLQLAGVIENDKYLTEIKDLTKIVVAKDEESATIVLAQLEDMHS